MMDNTLACERTRHMGRDAVRLANGQVELVAQALGSMTPVFAARTRGGFLNAHWIPPFRLDRGGPYTEKSHGAFWKSRLLYELAGDFLCSPNFGPACSVDGADIPPHGWTSVGEWALEKAGVDEAAGEAYAVFSLDSPAKEMPLSWTRRDMVLSGQGAFFSSVAIRNRGDKAVSINVARHATLGPPFLEAGCLISLCADRFMTPPPSGEFSATGRLAEGAEFRRLSEAPLRGGGRIDLSLVPGLVGFTDFASGAIPSSLGLGWSCVANPRLSLAYVCFFPGRAALPEGEIALAYNDLWMQYGGRRFTPWAAAEGEADRTYCLGTESAVGAFANGLAYSRRSGELLGNPTLVEIPALSERMLHYGAALVELDGELAGDAPLSVDTASDGELVLKGRRGSQRIGVQADFAASRRAR
jgi:hypothetical protein